MDQNIDEILLNSDKTNALMTNFTQKIQSRVAAHEKLRNDINAGLEEIKRLSEEINKIKLSIDQSS